MNMIVGSKRVNLCLSSQPSKRIRNKEIRPTSDLNSVRPGLFETASFSRANLFWDNSLFQSIGPTTDPTVRSYSIGCARLMQQSLVRSAVSSPDDRSDIRDHSTPPRISLRSSGLRLPGRDWSRSDPGSLATRRKTHLHQASASASEPWERGVRLPAAKTSCTSPSFSSPRMIRPLMSISYQACEI